MILAFGDVLLHKRTKITVLHRLKPHKILILLFWTHQLIGIPRQDPQQHAFVTDPCLGTVAHYYGLSRCLLEAASTIEWP